jgi:two-component system, chemotaxis family, chemotaxis protein CheY
MSALSEVKVLVVDDSPFMSTLICEMLKAMGVGKVLKAASGLEALQIIQSDQTIDVAFIDWLMRPMNGIELVRGLRLKAKGRLQRLPIIACTAYTDVKRVLALRDSGVNEVLTKPVSPAALYDKLCAVLYQSRLFVVSPNYVGPDRRRRAIAINFEDRRAGKLDQFDIDEMFG